MWIFISSFILVFLIGVFFWVKTKEQLYLYLFGFIGTVVGLFFIKLILKRGGAISFMGKLYSNKEFIAK
jgi:uncharacterized membrane protein YhfC